MTMMTTINHTAGDGILPKLFANANMNVTQQNVGYGSSDLWYCYGDIIDKVYVVDRDETIYVTPRSNVQQPMF